MKDLEKNLLLQSDFVGPLNLKERGKLVRNSVKYLNQVEKLPEEKWNKDKIETIRSLGMYNFGICRQNKIFFAQGPRGRGRKVGTVLIKKNLIRLCNPRDYNLKSLNYGMDDFACRNATPELRQKLGLPAYH